MTTSVYPEAAGKVKSRSLRDDGQRGRSSRGKKREARRRIGEDGLVLFRTRPLPESSARRFAKCLQANGRFDRVMVVRDARYGSWHVDYAPSSHARQDALQDEQQRARSKRAAEHGPGYQWWQDPDSGLLWWVLSDSGEVYEVTLHGSGLMRCNCPDYEMRCRRAGLDCKHIVAFAQHLGQFTPAQAAEGGVTWIWS